MFVAYSELKCVTSGTEIINIIIVVIVIIVGFIIIIIVIIIASPWTFHRSTKRDESDCLYFLAVCVLMWVRRAGFSQY